MAHLTIAEAEKKWEFLKNNLKKGNVQQYKSDILDCMKCFNINDKEKIRIKNTKYPNIHSENDLLEEELKGKDWRELYKQHFPEDDRI